MNNFEKSIEEYSKTEFHKTLFELCSVYKNSWKMFMKNSEYGITFYCDGLSNDICRKCPFYLIKDMVAKELEKAILYGYKEDKNGNEESKRC